MKLIAILILGISLNTFGQGYLVLKNGERLTYDGLRIHKDRVLVDMPGTNEELEIDPAEVLGYYRDDENVLHYLKHVDDSTSNVGYRFVQKELSGNINLYTRTETARTEAGGQTSTYYYIEKANRFENVLVTNTFAQNKGRKIKILRSYLDDIPEVVNTLGEDFRLNPENIMNAIRRYNLIAFENLSLQSTANKRLILYRRGRGKGTDQLTVSIDDKTFIVAHSDYIEIKIGNFSKVCIEGENRSCEIVEGSPFYTTFYEVKADANSSFTINKKPKNEAEYYLNEIRRVKEKASRK